MLIVIDGDIRTGKTTLLSIFAKASNKPKIFSNIKMNLSNYNALTYKNIGNLPENIDVFIDEAYTWLESRRSSKDTNLLASHILFQSGKTFTNFYLTLQLFSALDKRFREMSNVIIESSKYDEFQLFKYDIYIRVKGNLIYNKTKLLPYTQAFKYFKLFNTYEIVKSDLAEKFEIGAILQDNTKLKNTVKEIAKLVKQKLKNNKPTHSNIRIIMLDLKYPLIYIKKLESFVHSYLNLT